MQHDTLLDRQTKVLNFRVCFGLNIIKTYKAK